MVDKTTRKHEPTEDCDGFLIPLGNGNKKCFECDEYVCPCELAYGHDCEA